MNFNKLSVVVVFLLLFGCDLPISASQRIEGTYEHYSVIDDARHKSVTIGGVQCISVTEGYAGGLSCNWEKFNAESK